MGLRRRDFIENDRPAKRVDDGEQRRKGEQKRGEDAGEHSHSPAISLNSCSLRMRSPSSAAFFALEPASSPTTTKSVFFETDSVTFAPSASARAFASGRAML